MKAKHLRGPRAPEGRGLPRGLLARRASGSAASSASPRGSSSSRASTGRGTIDAVVGRGRPDADVHRRSPRRSLDAIASSVRRHGRRVPVLLRLTSGSQVRDGCLRRQGHRGATMRPIRRWTSLASQFFSGTQKDSLKRLSRELAKLGDFVHGLEDETGFSVRVLEYGPGLPVDYYEAGGSADEGEFLDEFSELLRPLVAERRGRARARSQASRLHAGTFSRVWST